MLEEQTNAAPQPSNGFARFGLPPFLLTSLAQAGFEQPTPIQAEAIPLLLEGRDLVAQSQTGSGKTAAFAVPLLARVQRKSRDVQALVMVPTRELALQVTSVFKTLAGPAVRVTPIYGGTGMTGQIRGLMQGGYQVVVGTPGRLRDLLNQGYLRLDKVQMIVLDEADEMLDMGFARDVEAIVSAAPESARRQMALFSATLPEWVLSTVNKHLRPGYSEVKLASDADARPSIEHIVYDMNQADKHTALRHLLDNDAKEAVLVFARTKHGVKKLADRLQSEGYSAEGLQGNLSQKAREAVVNAFRTSRIRIMVATNVGARGLDVKGINHVINYDLPESAELFTHRVGRTARNGASGTAITFLTREDRVKWREIERAAQTEGVPFNRRAWDGPRGEKEAPSARPMVAPPQFGSRPRYGDRNGSFEFEGGRRPNDFRRDDSARRPAAVGEGVGGARRPYGSDFDRSDSRPAAFDRSDRRPRGRDDFNAGNGDTRSGGFDRPAPRGGNFDRSDSRPGNFDRSDNRPGGFDRSDSRPGNFDRSDNRPGRFDRSDSRPGGFDRSEPRSGGFDRSDNRPAKPRFIKDGVEGSDERTFDRPAPRGGKPFGTKPRRRSVGAGR